MDSKQFYFVDESGDSVFYNRRGKYIVGKEGCSPILIIGLIKTKNPSALRQALHSLKEIILKDPYFQGVPSLKKTEMGFHAKDDLPEVRLLVYKKLAEMDFKAEFVVARKNQQVFKSKHKNDEDLFYFDLVSKLFENKLHKEQENVICFSKRGNRSRQQHFEKAIQNAKINFENKWSTPIKSNIQILVQIPSGEPCLQIIDYMNWAVYRAFTKQEDRFLKSMENKISFLTDIYDFDKYPKNFYNSKNKFEIRKISPL